MILWTRGKHTAPAPFLTHSSVTLMPGGIAGQRQTAPRAGASRPPGAGHCPLRRERDRQNILKGAPPMTTIERWRAIAT